MKKNYYFIAGLPRSGSSLLSAIINQNPNFYSGPASPVLPLITKIEFDISTHELYCAYKKPLQAHEILSSLIDHYYSDISEPVIFDKNRSWTHHINYIEGYIKTRAKIICLVRSIDEILISFLNIIHKNKNEINFNIIDKSVISQYGSLTDYNRCNVLLDGIITDAVSALKFPFENELSDRVLLVEYNDLVLNPQLILEKIYNFLEEEYYYHNLDFIENKNLVDDENCYGLSGLHEVRTKLQMNPKNNNIILPNDILNRCKDMEFWRK